MYTQNLPMRFARAMTTPRFAAGVLASLTLLAAACSESASHLTSPPQVSGASNKSIATASNFAVLANAAVTCTDGTVTGDVGTFQADPVGSVTRTTCPMSSPVHVGDGVAQLAFNNFLGTYTALAPKPEDVCTTLTGTLDGVTLSPGAYCFDVAATVTGLLTLDGPSNGMWIFKIGTSGTGALTGTGFSVAMAGGGKACNVTWWVADAVTMTGSAFQGNILAGVAITLTGGTLNGHASSRSDVTITGTAVTACEGG